MPGAAAGEARARAMRAGARRRKRADTVAAEARIVETVKAYIGIGSNLGEREHVIAAALDLLRAEDGVELLAVSTLRETDPVGYLDQPRFLNGGGAGGKALTPPRVLGPAPRNGGPPRGGARGRPPLR